MSTYPFWGVGHCLTRNIWGIAAGFWDDCLGESWPRTRCGQGQFPRPVVCPLRSGRGSGQGMSRACVNTLRSSLLPWLLDQAPASLHLLPVALTPSTCSLPDQLSPTSFPAVSFLSCVCFCFNSFCSCMDPEEAEEGTRCPPLSPTLFFFLQIYLLIYLFLSAMGLHCCVWAFSSCGKRGLLSSCSMWTSHCYGFSCWEAQALSVWASVDVAHGLSCPTHVGSSWTRDRTRVPCIGRRILNHWATREGSSRSWF